MFKRAVVLTSAAIWLAAAGAAAAQKAQYSTKDIINTFAGKQAPGGTCESKGMATGDDGVCEPVKDSRGFSLPTRATVRTPSAKSAPAAAPVLPTARRVASVPARPAAAAAAPHARRDLMITFKLGSADLTEQAKANARVFAEALKSPALADTRFDIDGYTDSTGDKDKNQALSQARADAVKSYLVAQGVPDSRLQAHGFGASDFVTTPTSARNRRVEARRAD